MLLYYKVYSKSKLCLRIFLLFPDAVIDQHNNLNYWEQQYSKPYFDTSTEKELTATAGQTALLQCKVRNLGDRAVS